jgi:membrane fusion protein (multidrug efflux system)
MDSFQPGRGLVVVGAGVMAALGLAGCGRTDAVAPPPLDVQVVSVARRDVPVTRDWVGSLDGFVNAQIHAQVQGYLVRQDYSEGMPVKKGDLLFEIDPRTFDAALARAEGTLAVADAALAKAELDVRRDEPLVRDKALSQEELDDAAAAGRAAAAEVASAKAAAEEARLEAGFTRISSPIDGVAGLARGQIGDLVGPSTGVLTSVSQIDPIKAYFPVSEQAYLELRAKGGGSPIPAGTQFTLILSDGSTYPRAGTFYAIDSQVDANTGTLRAVVLFPNPEGLLRPGQFAKVRAVVSVEKGALVVPQRALAELQGGYQAATVDADNHAHIVNVRTGPQLGPDIVVESGLHAGDRIVADGPQKIRDDAPVNPVAAAAPEAGR